MIQEYNGVKFYLSSTSGYWERARGTPRKMHVYVWECNKGKIPLGYCLHHIDYNKDNNNIENLQLLTFDEHALLHNKLIVAREVAKEWHSSEEGLEWHKQHGKDIAQNWIIKEYKCVQCGSSFT